MLRHVLINQHRLQKCLQQQTRLCSTAQANQNVEDLQSNRSVNEGTPRYLPEPKPTVHRPDNGRLFSVSLAPIFLPYGSLSVFSLKYSTYAYEDAH